MQFVTLLHVFFYYVRIITSRKVYLRPLLNSVLKSKQSLRNNRDPPSSYYYNASMRTTWRNVCRGMSAGFGVSPRKTKEIARFAALPASSSPGSDLSPFRPVFIICRRRYGRGRSYKDKWERVTARATFNYTRCAVRKALSPPVPFADFCGAGIAVGRGGRRWWCARNDDWGTDHKLGFGPRSWGILGN